MTVGELVELVKVRCVDTLALAKKPDVIIKFISLGVSELYNKFNLSIKSETLVETVQKTLYELRNPDVNLLLTVYDSTGRELRQTDTYDARDFDYKILNYRSFLLKNPIEGELLHAVYKASPPVLKDVNDTVDLPESMIEALLTYVSYVGHGTINKDNMQEASFYMQRFQQLCMELDAQGYRIPLNSETLSVYSKGYA